MFMYCSSCKEKVEVIDHKLGFRSICDNCEADLHTCKNCKYYSIGKPNDCLVPNTEYVEDREKSNFCEEFSFLSSLREESRVKKEDIAKKLFKDDDDDQNPISFDSLFKK